MGSDLKIEGEFFQDRAKLAMYATDASAFREIPYGVCFPKNIADLKILVEFASKNNLSLIPRGAGTSLAGQVVGKGIIIDFSKYFTEIVEINPEEKWVSVQPGVVLDELNLILAKHNLFFAPETSTSNRCVIGGMVGNNSSGLHSLIYGTTREHLISAKAILSDGSEVEFKALSKDEFQAKLKGDNLEAGIYKQVNSLFKDPDNLIKIDREFPDPEVVRRNTGYALDELSNCSIFKKGSKYDFNFCKLLAGSEGTLALITEVKLALIPKPPAQKALVCIHFESVTEAIRANVFILKHNPGAVELMDDKILALSSGNIEQNKNRFFIKGDPGALLMVEFANDIITELDRSCERLILDLKEKHLGYHYPIIKGKDISRVWNLRKAGLGIMSNMPGDAKPVSVIEDTSVHPDLLEDYIKEFNEILKKYKLECVYHAHISVGELHLRPILNLKDTQDVQLFRTIAEETAYLVKKYKGSLSGEHGDGRLRGEFIPIMVGDEIYQWFKDIKSLWDPNGVFNENKIVDTPKMNTFLRYEPGVETPEIDTIFDFSGDGGFMRSVEKCNGSGDCRKTELIGGLMCPSYMATRNEENTTRARANVLREFLSKNGKIVSFDHKEIYDVLDLCLSCKGCKSECPSSVDIAKLKAEFLQHYYDVNGIPLRARLISYITTINKLGSIFPSIFNAFVTNTISAGLLKKFIGFAKERSIPKLEKSTLESWCRKNLKELNKNLDRNAQSVYLFMDEFTNYNDVSIGIKTIKLLTSLGYRVKTVRNTESGRTFISKGLLRTAQQKAIFNIKLYKDLVSEKATLIGIEPSAILSFRDEYPDLVSGDLKDSARKIANNALMVEEFLLREMEAGRIFKEQFTTEEKSIKLHGHCQQKAVSSTDSSLKLLSLPENYRVEEIPSGCCGMAGSFGFEKEHYNISMKIGELVLFPAVRKSDEKIIIAAPGTSCRTQIKDGTGKVAIHPVEILFEALKKN
ncbi:MAG: FAD-binding protein [Bacteroidales bacterium]|nr:FAD-binding protein [Bacteroidales bacterium]MCF8391735.1 FAD-binding protein [Bacteroidales bacterium]